MKKSAITVLGVLLLVNQSIIMGAELDTQKIVANMDDVITIIVKQGNITEIRDVDAIVNPTNFQLDHDGEISRALKEADPEWYESNKYYLDKEENRLKLDRTEVFITPTFKLRNNGVNYIINAVTPTGSDPEWEEDLERIYFNTLGVANISEITSLAFPPIIHGNFSFNSEGKVKITPTEEAKIAIDQVKCFIESLKSISIKKIYFIISPNDGLGHFLAYKAALQLTDPSENHRLMNLEKDYIEKLEKRYEEEEEAKKTERTKRFSDFIEKVKTWKWKGALGLATFATLLYLIKKYYSSR